MALPFRYLDRSYLITTVKKFMSEAGWQGENVSSVIIERRVQKTTFSFDQFHHWRHDFNHNDINYNDTQHNGLYYNTD
jgi:hypothetical protein